MSALQCPDCDLRFAFASELVDHLRRDHPDFHANPGSVEEDLLAACHCHHHPGSGARRPSAPAAA